MKLLIYGTLLLFISANQVYSQQKCNSIYVRWLRVKLVFGSRAEGPYSLNACRNACSKEEDLINGTAELQCSGFNYRPGTNPHTHHCQLFQADQLQHVDGFVEADDRYSFYWKYCIKSEKTCLGDYAFTYLSDRYMDAREVNKLVYTSTLEDCLSACLDEKKFSCRSVSFNRTDGGCHISQQNQLSKPALIRMNNNPNYRIDYYENNCFNITDSFTFNYECKDDGILVKVDSKYPYTGAMYGLYDFFTCRVEPKEAKHIEYFFQSPTVSKNCSDSIRYKGNDMVLEIVLSTDGVEPLYFITPDDLTYQARCPLKDTKELGSSIDLLPNYKHNHIDLQQFTKSAQALFSILSNMSSLAESDEDAKGLGLKTGAGLAGDLLTNMEAKIYSRTTKNTFSLPSTTQQPEKNPSLDFTTLPPETDTISSSTATTETREIMEATTITTTASSTIVTATPSTTATKPWLTAEATTPSIQTTNASTTALSPENGKTTSPINLTTPTVMTTTTQSTVTVERTTAKENTFIPAQIQATVTDNKHIENQTSLLINEQSMTEIENITDSQENEGKANVHSSTNRPTIREELNSSVSLNSTINIQSKANAEHLSNGSSKELENATSVKQTFTTHTSFPRVTDEVPSNDKWTEPTKQVFTLPEAFLTTKTIATETQTVTATGLTVVATTNIPEADDDDADSESSNELTTKDITNSTNYLIASSTPTISQDETTTVKTSTEPLITSSFKTTFTSRSTVSTTLTTSKSIPVTETTTGADTTTPETLLLSSSLSSTNKDLPTIKYATPTQRPIEPIRRLPKEPVTFDIFHNGQPVEAVVVGSRITLSFTPFYAIPPSYMTISGCQVEPIGSLYEWEREPLAIIKDGCQSDHVGLVCPPQRTDYGIRVTVESFRYQTTAQVQYSCLVRICPFAPCPTTSCPSVEGCANNDLLTRTFGLWRMKRHLTIEDIRAALAANPDLQRQIRLTNHIGTQGRTSSETQQQLITLGGDHIVKKRLVVVNSEDQLRYYVRTGDVPDGK